jgi:hypothetical protein
VIGKFVVGENGPWNNVRSHRNLLSLMGGAALCYKSMTMSP